MSSLVAYNPRFAVLLSVQCSPALASDDWRLPATHTGSEHAHITWVIRCVLPAGKFNHAALTSCLIRVANSKTPNAPLQSGVLHQIKCCLLSGENVCKRCRSGKHDCMLKAEVQKCPKVSQLLSSPSPAVSIFAWETLFCGRSSSSVLAPLPLVQFPSKSSIVLLPTRLQLVLLLMTTNAHSRPLVNASTSSLR